MLASIWTLFTMFTGGLTLLVSYITTNAFPHPLSEEEESRYIEKMRQGDRESRDILTRHNLRLVAHVVKKFDLGSEMTDDLISIGTIGLMKALDTYRPDKGTRLATYACRCVENEILMFLRSNKKNRSEVSLYETVGVDKEGNEIILLDILGTHNEIVAELVENKLELQRLMEMITSLPDRERKVLEMRFGLTPAGIRTQREIARELQISRSYVSRIEKRAIKRLVEMLAGENPVKK